MDAASSTRIRPSSWSAGTPAATLPSTCFGSSNCGATPGASAVSPRMSAASARPRASHPAARASASACRWWRRRSPCP
jgi:hypothetical protein